MEAIELTVAQREQMALLIGQLTTTRTVAEAFVGYFAKELGINLQVYQFNADTFRFEPVGGMAPRPDPEGSPPRFEDVHENGKVKA